MAELSCKSKPWSPHAHRTENGTLLGNAVFSFLEENNNCLLLAFVPCIAPPLCATRRRCPLVTATCYTSRQAHECQTLHRGGYPSTQRHHPGWELHEQTFECHFLRAKPPLPFPFGALLSPEERSCLFFKPNALRTQLLSGSCGATSHM